MRSWAMAALALMGATVGAQQAPPQKATGGFWTEEEAGDGVVWRRGTFLNLGGAPQLLNVLEADLSAGGRALKLMRTGASVEKLTAVAAPTEAIAAVNAGGADSKGAPLGLLKVDGHVWSTLDTTQPARAALGILKSGAIEMRRIEPGADWPDVEHAVGAGPMLVEKGKVLADFPAEGFEDAFLRERSARTAAGLTSSGRLLLVTVDGARSDAAGLSIPDLAQVMKDLGCVTAMNLDGAGATSMWVRGEPGGGLVNRPSDRGGERPVASGLLLVAADVTVFDDSEPCFERTPPAKWEHVASRAPGQTSVSSVALGDGYHVAREGAGALAVWKLAVDFNGTYEIFARWPKGKFTKKAVYQVVAGIEQQQTKVDQSAGAGTWVSLGRYVLQKGVGAQRVELVAEDGAPLAADAVKVVLAK